MTVDLPKLLALAQANPERVGNLLKVVVDGFVQNPQILVDAVPLLQGGDPLRFILAHPKYTAEVAGELSKNLFLDPPLFAALLNGLRP